MRHNREAFERWRIVPRMLHGTTTRDLTTTVLGTELRSPVLLAPVGAGALVTPDSDVHIASGAAAARTSYVFSSQGCSPMEDTARSMGDTPFWYQLYWSTDEPLVDSMIHRAEACGARALVVTLDTTTLGWRPQDLTLGSLPFAQGEGIAQYTSDPRFREIIRERIAARLRTGREGRRHPRRDPQPALDHAQLPGPVPRQPALAGAAQGGRDLPRHLLQPGALVGPPRHPARAHDAADPAQGDPAPGRRGRARWTPASTG